MRACSWPSVFLLRFPRRGGNYNNTSNTGLGWNTGPHAGDSMKQTRLIAGTSRPDNLQPSLRRREGRFNDYPISGVDASASKRRGTSIEVYEIVCSVWEHTAAKWRVWSSESHGTPRRQRQQRAWQQQRELRRSLRSFLNVYLQGAGAAMAAVSLSLIRNSARLRQPTIRPLSRIAPRPKREKGCASTCD